MKVLVTGAAGFIGAKLSRCLADRGDDVVGLEKYADTSLLESEIGYHPHWSLHDGIEQFIAWYNSCKNPLQ